MKKKNYIIPQMEMAQIESCHLMDSSMTFTPPQPAPGRRTYDGTHRTPVF